jgi:hypothetical protein
MALFQFVILSFLFGRYKNRLLKGVEPVFLFLKRGISIQKGLSLLLS